MKGNREILVDPRLSIINHRLANVKRLIAVSGGKGGIGKSSIASMLALILSERGSGVGLLDLDFHCPSAHVILGVKGGYPQEDKGILPPRIHNVKFMSIMYYTHGNPMPLRGTDISNAIIELCAVTLWEKLDFLVIDMPPGAGDTVLDIIRLISRLEFLIVTTASKLNLEVANNVLRMLKELDMSVLGIVENLKDPQSVSVQKNLKDFGIPFLGEIGRDSNFEHCIGDANKLMHSNFARDLKKIANFL